MKSSTTTKILCGLILAIIFAGSASGGGQSNPRSMAMGGAYTALAYGLEAGFYNPANLGLSLNKKFSLDLVTVGAEIKNNSFSLKDYNEYNGRFWNEEDKQAILDRIPAEGLRFNATAEASGMNFSIWRLAFNFRGRGESMLQLNKDPFELLLFGNEVRPGVYLNNNRGEAIAIGDASISYGQPLFKWTGGEFAVGATFHYFYGFAHQEIIEASGGILTTDSGFVGDAQAVIRSALGGSGQAVDLGASMIFAKNWVISAGLENLYSKIKWDKETEETRFTFQMDPVTLETLLDSEDDDSLTETSDTTYPIGSFTTTLPAQLKLGIAKLGRKLTIAFDWSQATSSKYSQSTNPRVAGGLEYKPIGLLPLRIGAATGGNKGTILSGGLGLHFGPFHMDMAIAGCGSFIPAASKGVAFAYGIGLRF